MPVALIAVTSFCTVYWTFHGFYTQTFPVLLTNSVGIVLNWFQLFIVCIFHPSLSKFFDRIKKFKEVKIFQRKSSCANEPEEEQPEEELMQEIKYKNQEEKESSAANQMDLLLDDSHELEPVWKDDTRDFQIPSTEPINSMSQFKLQTVSV
eukprot:gb/GECH01005890.1/.p1 GENE.gb/GECH01005890.1/~~gb/GECH01005890.1/.p1  ORF type:complete len:151 (+),score=22.87 gb/GECH01005890.1/:1-453(+)